jgi:hypothetical protein
LIFSASIHTIASNAKQRGCPIPPMRDPERLYRTCGSHKAIRASRPPSGRQLATRISNVKRSGTGPIQRPKQARRRTLPGTVSGGFLDHSLQPSFRQFVLQQLVARFN